MSASIGRTLLRNGTIRGEHLTRGEQAWIANKVTRREGFTYTRYKATNKPQPLSNVPLCRDVRGLRLLQPLRADPLRTARIRFIERIIGGVGVEIEVISAPIPPTRTSEIEGTTGAAIGTAGAEAFCGFAPRRQRS